MKKNMGVIDRVFRILLAIILGILYLTGVVSGTLSIILLIFVAVFVLTGLFGVCPLYLPFGFGTTKSSNGN